MKRSIRTLALLLCLILTLSTLLTSCDLFTAPSVPPVDNGKVESNHPEAESTAPETTTPEDSSAPEETDPADTADPEDNENPEGNDPETNDPEETDPDDGESEVASTSTFYGFDMLLEDLVQFEYDEKGRFLGATRLDLYTLAPVNTTSTYDLHRYFYDADGKLDYAIVSGMLFKGFTESDGKMVATSAAANSLLMSEISLELSFHENGKIKEEHFFEGSEFLCRYVYDEAGRLLAQIDGDGDTSFSVYTENKMTLYIAPDLNEEQITKSLNGTFDILSTAEAFYMLDFKNDLPVSASYCEEGEWITSFTWTYNNKGKCVRSADEYGSVFEMTYDEDGRIVNAEGTEVYVGWEADSILYDYTYTYTEDGQIDTVTKEMIGVDIKEKPDDTPSTSRSLEITIFHYTEDGIFDGFTTVLKDYDEDNRQTYEHTAEHDKYYHSDSYNEWHLEIEKIQPENKYDPVEEVEYKCVTFSTILNEEGYFISQTTHTKKYLVETDRLVKEIEEIATSDGHTTTEKYYRDDGFRVYKKVVTEMTFSPVVRTITTTEYDMSGNIVSETVKTGTIGGTTSQPGDGMSSPSDAPSDNDYNDDADHSDETDDQPDNSDDHQGAAPDIGTNPLSPASPLPLPGGDYSDTDTH